LACVSCSLRKGARLRAVDPETGDEAFSTIHDAIFGPSISSGMACA
jgi:hypothetical protein